MEKNWSLRDAFAYFGARATNPRWSWSARSTDGETVVLTWWLDEISRDDAGKLVRDERNHPRFSVWNKLPGNKDRIKNLAWARAHCEGLFRVVWIKSKDRRAIPRYAATRYPDPKLWMRLTYLDEQTGEFAAVEK